MKKILIALLALLPLIACEKEKSDDSDLDVDIDTVNPENKYETTISTDYEVCGYKYNLFSGYPCPSARISTWGISSDLMLDDYFKTVKDSVDFLVSVATCNAKSSKISSIVRDMSVKYGYFSTLNLNRYTDSNYSPHIFFGGQVHNTSLFYVTDVNTLLIQKDSDEDGFYRNEGIITGLRCVVVNSGTEPKATIAKDGVIWRLVPSYCGNKDLNYKAGGDDIYLYYTKEYTGRQITLVNPYLVENLVGYDSDVESNKLLVQLLGSVCTWSGDPSTESWKPTAKDLIHGIKQQAYWASEMKYCAANFIENHVDFVMLYDANMEQTFDSVGDNDRPANLNRNAGGFRQFLSYNYITEADTKYNVPFSLDRSKSFLSQL